MIRQNTWPNEGSPWARHHQWSLALRNFDEAVLHVRNMKSGLIPAISLFNILAISRLGYTASFVAPTKEVFTLVRERQRAIEPYGGSVC